jgi:CheY-like chemotaxis protein
VKTHPVVLYVEDDELSCEIMRLLLEDEMGLAHVTIFPDSMDFMGRLQALAPQPDIILLDIHMKPFTGFEMLKMLRQTSAYQTVLVVALTASVMNEEIQQLQTAGFNSVIAKPIDQDTFPAILSQIMQGAQIWHIT